jgi:chromosomal replication initiation ATPase DnaA
MTLIRCRECGYINSVTASIADDVVERIAAIAGDLFAVAPDQILSRSRRPRVLAARNAVCAVMRNDFHMSYPDIGAAVDRDHATVMHAVRRCDPLMMRRLADAVAHLAPASP